MIRQLATDLFAGLLFGNCALGDQWSLTPCVFLPLGLGALSQWTPEEIGQIGQIVETLDKAGDRCVNGFPMFFSCRILHKDDWAEIVRLRNAMADAVAAVG